MKLRIVMEASNSLAITTEKLFYAINTGNREELFEILNGVSSMSGQVNFFPFKH
jgi:hypothetical protein